MHLPAFQILLGEKKNQHEKGVECLRKPHQKGREGQQLYNYRPKDTIENRTLL